MAKNRKHAARVDSGKCSCKPIVACAGLALGGAVLTVGALYTELMTSVVARRRSPGTDAIIAMATGNPADGPEPSFEESAARILELPTETVAIRSHDDYVLRAHWYPVEGATRTVLLAHGWHSRWNYDFSGAGPFLHDSACNLLFIEQRCHGQSGGDLIAYGILERRDILSWIEWLEANHPGYPLYLCGISMGAASVLMTAELPVAGRVAGIIADCGYSTPDEIIKLTLEKAIGKLAGPTYAAVNLNCKVRGKFSFGDHSPVEAMAKNTEIPCLFIHGDDDKLVPVRMSVENFYACQAPKDILIVHGAAHGLSFVVDPEAYKAKVLAFFEAYDTPVNIPKPEKKKRRRKKESVE